MTLNTDDFIEVVKEGHPQEGLVGRVMHASQDIVVAKVYGKLITFLKDEVKLRAKMYSRAHMVLNHSAIEWNTDRLTKEDVYSLMDYALDVGDYAWCKELQDQYNAMR